MNWPKKRLETLGGIGSILTGILCTVIGVVDLREQASGYRIWFVMFAVLVLNGIAMLRHAAKRPADPVPLSPHSMHEVLKVRS